MRIPLAKHLMLSNGKKFWKLKKLTWATNLLTWMILLLLLLPALERFQRTQKNTQSSNESFSNTTEGTPVSADPATIHFPGDIPDGLDEIPLFHVSETEWKDSKCVMAAAHDESEDAVTKDKSSIESR